MADKTPVTEKKTRNRAKTVEPPKSVRIGGHYILNGTKDSYVVPLKVRQAGPDMRVTFEDGVTGEKNEITLTFFESHFMYDWTKDAKLASQVNGLKDSIMASGVPANVEAKYKEFMAFAKGFGLEGVDIDLPQVAAAMMAAEEVEIGEIAGVNSYDEGAK